MRQNPQRLGDGVFAVDTEHVRREADASYLIVDGGRAAFVDTGTHRSVPNLLAALRALDIDVERVDYVLLTHVHLDHAGGAGALMASLPRARVVVHPRGAPHLTDPAKLLAAAKTVYGDEVFAAQFGEAVAIPAERIATVADGERLAFGPRTLEFLHTPGHTLHHICIFDRDTRELFTGDTFGVSYRDSDTAAGSFIFATTSPSQFDPEQLRASVSRLAALEPRCAYLTHYGRVEAIAKLARDLDADIDAVAHIARASAAAPDRLQRIARELFAHLSRRLQAHGFAGDETARHALLDYDVALNAAGLDAWLRRAG
jgi:glyoxylase-like metal-dependent hydrolase (beta-lactamase superfamily II)